MSGNGSERDALDVMVVEALVTWLERSPSTITYGDLSKRIARMFSVEEPDPWRTFDAPLGRIQVACDDLGLPCLPAMVVTKRRMEPGVGFAALHRSRHPEDDGLSDAELASREVSRVRACWDWQRILDAYGIDHSFAGAKDVAAERRAEQSYEESSRLVESLRREQARSSRARKRCLELKGTRCAVCGFDPVESWGVPGVIQVHHLRSLHESLRDAGATQTDPLRDLVPVCPNCHSLIHSKPRAMGGPGCYTIEEAAAIVWNAAEQAEKGRTS